MCLFPWTASLDPDGGKPKADPEGALRLPCGKCSECISLRAFEWGIRARHEISLHKQNCFITLSYDDEHNNGPILLKKPFQDFMKRLRKHAKKKLSYMVSHEYGTQTYRPHHHAIIFGWSPPKQELVKYSKSGHPLFKSDDLSKLWTQGYHSIGEANEKTAYYIASYALKGKQHEFTDSDGEYHSVSDTFDCSKRPGIGLNYFLQNYKQLLDSKSILPRYYQKKLEEYYPDLFEEYQNEKMFMIQDRGAQERLAKFTISAMNKNINSGEYRSAPNDSLDYYYKRYLKKEVQTLKREK